MFAGLRTVVLLACTLACASPRAHPEVGAILDGDTGATISFAELRGPLARAEFVLLGETHDHPEHHRLQARVLEAILASGRRPALVVEMIDADRQAALDAWRGEGGGPPEALARAVAWEESGWPDFSLYAPVFRVALDADLPILAGDLSEPLRDELGAEDADPERLAEYGMAEPLPAEVAQRLASDLLEAHCGYLPEEALPGMIRLQRARDGSLARALVEGAELADGAVLLAGAEHARLDRGVPRPLARLAPGRDLLALAFLELPAGGGPAREEILAAYEPSAVPFDAVWLTAPHDPRDPCERFRESLEGLAGEIPGSE